MLPRVRRSERGNQWERGNHRKEFALLTSESAFARQNEANMHQPHDGPTKPLNETRARQAVTGHTVRYVLMFGLLGVIVVFAAVLVTFT